MKRILFIILVLLISTTFVVQTFAQNKPAVTDKPVAPTDKSAVTNDKPSKIYRSFRAKKGGGEVLRVDVAESTMVVLGKKGEETFNIKDAKWKVYKNAEEVRTGDFVVIAFTDVDGKKVARRIVKVKKPVEKKAVIEKDEAKPAFAKPADPTTVK